MGWEITKVRNKDDGIDIEAFRSIVSGEKEKTVDTRMGQITKEMVQASSLQEKSGLSGLPQD